MHEKNHQLIDHPLLLHVSCVVLSNVFRCAKLINHQCELLHPELSVSLLNFCRICTGNGICHCELKPGCYLDRGGGAGPAARRPPDQSFDRDNINEP